MEDGGHGKMERVKRRERKEEVMRGGLGGIKTGKGYIYKEIVDEEIRAE